MKKILSFFKLLCLYSLVILFAISCGPKDHFCAMHVVNKTSYNDFISYIEKCQKKIKETKYFIFEFDFEDNSTYSIKGIINHKDKDKDPENVNYRIKYRSYYITSYLSQSKMIVSYQPAIDYDKASLAFDYDGVKYLLNDINGNTVLILEFKDCLEEIINSKLNYFLNHIISLT